MNDFQEYTKELEVLVESLKSLGDSLWHKWLRNRT